MVRNLLWKKESGSTFNLSKADKKNAKLFFLANGRSRNMRKRRRDMDSVHQIIYNDFKKKLDMPKIRLG